jgi:hypothetical protein
MPIPIKVVNGPSFQDLHDSGVLGVGDVPKALRFTVHTKKGNQMVCIDPLAGMDQSVLKKVWGRVVAIGRFGTPHSTFEQTLIIEALDGNEHAYYIVTSFNTTTRQGTGVLYESSEFFHHNPIARFLRIQPKISIEPPAQLLFDLSPTGNGT